MTEQSNKPKLSPLQEEAFAQWKADAEALLSDAKAIAISEGWDWRDPDIQLKCAIAATELREARKAD